MKSHFYPSSYEPNPKLLSAIIVRIHEEERKRAVRRISVCSVISVGSLAGLIPMWEYLYKALEVSGFIQYVALMFSDWSLVLGHLGNYLSSLGESLPVVELTLFLLLAVLLLGSFSYILNGLRSMRKIGIGRRIAA